MTQSTVSQPYWQGTLADAAYIISHIRRIRAFGRLSWRNGERVGIAHLYFRAGQLAQVVGHRGDALALLTELKIWRQATLRFDRSVITSDSIVQAHYDPLLDDVLYHLQNLGVVKPLTTSTKPLVIEGEVVASSEVQPLIAPWEWHMLVEGVRRIILAVARVVGIDEAFRILQDVLDDCSTTFPVFACLQIAANGYLHVIDQTQLNSISRSSIIEGFAALVATCQYFCTHIIGPQDAQKLVMQSLSEVGPILIDLGVMRPDPLLLLDGQ